MPGVGRVALTNALRQVGRRFGQEAMEGIMGGEAIESVLSREEMRELAKKLGRSGFMELMQQGKNAVMEDYNNKMNDWNTRMNDFARNLDDEFRKNTTLYKEVRNIQNKNKIED